MGCKTNESAQCVTWEVGVEAVGHSCRGVFGQNRGRVCLMTLGASTRAQRKRGDPAQTLARLVLVRRARRSEEKKGLVCVVLLLLRRRIHR